VYRTPALQAHLKRSHAYKKGHTMTFEASAAGTTRAQLLPRLLDAVAVERTPSPEPKRTAASFSVLQATCAALLANGNARNLDARFTAAAVDAAAVRVAGAAHELEATGGGFAFDGTDPYEEAGRAAGLALLHLRRAQLQLAIVRTSDRTLLEAIHALEDASVQIAVLALVQPEAERLADHVAATPEVTVDVVAIRDNVGRKAEIPASFIVSRRNDDGSFVDALFGSIVPGQVFRVGDDPRLWNVVDDDGGDRFMLEWTAPLRADASEEGAAG
jgi:hypothetical protein